jgi:hypothetical protein
MIQIIPADKRHFSDFGWLKTYWLFSFSNYYDPSNIQFGALRVFNDEKLEANDQARIDLETDLELRSSGDTSFVLIDVPSCKGWGYDEKTLRGSKA